MSMETRFLGTYEPDKQTMRKLTDALVASLEPNGRDQFVFDTQQSGYLVRVTPAGAKLLQAQGYIARRKRRFTLGRHPELTVAVGRERALLALADMRRGADPVLEHKMRQAAVVAGDMVTAQLVDKWFVDYVRPKLKPDTVTDYEQMAAKHIKPALGHLPVKRVGRDDVVQLHLAMARTPRRANYVLSNVHTLFNFAEDLGLRPRGSNPANRIKRYRERVLTETEMPRAAEGIEAAQRAGKIGLHAAAGLRLALFTGARSGEITATQWSHIDWRRKLIRLPDSKINEPRTIHLSDVALEVLRTIPPRGPYVIAGAIDGKPFKNLSRSWIIARKFAGLDDVRLHDLRHSYASLAASRGVSLLTIGKLLGHRLPQTTARYAHLARDAVAAVNDELGAAMQAAIERGTPASAAVVKLRRPRRR
jgi:integrase